MAYLNFSEAGFAAAARSNHAVAPTVTLPTTARFSALEWLVIALAERDRPRSLRAPGRFARAAAALFGGSGDRPLAATRLEALRRMAVLARHHRGDVPAAEVAAFHRAGFSPDHTAALLASLAGGCDERR